MSTRSDSLALQSVLALSGAVALALWVRSCGHAIKHDPNTNAILQAQAPVQIANSSTPATVSLASASEVLPAPTVVKAEEPPTKPKPPPADDIEESVPTPQPQSKRIGTPKSTTRMRDIPRTHRLHVGPAKWSDPLQVFEGERVGLRFKLRKVQVERDGRAVETLHGLPMLGSAQIGNRGFTQTAWFGRGARILRFMSLENEEEDVEVLWEK